MVKTVAGRGSPSEVATSMLVEGLQVLGADAGFIGRLLGTDALQIVHVAGFAYDAPSRTATWTLSAPFADDRIVLDLAAAADPGAGRGVRAAGRGGATLDGEWEGVATAASGQQYPSGDGTAGGDFRFPFNTLAGDVNGDGRINAFDLADVKRRLNRTAGDGVSSTIF